MSPHLAILESIHERLNIFRPAFMVEQLTWGGFIRPEDGQLAITERGLAAIERNRERQRLRTQARQQAKAHEPPKKPAEPTTAERILKLLAASPLPQDTLCDRLSPLAGTTVRGHLVKLERAGTLERYTAPVTKNHREFDATWWRLKTCPESAEPATSTAVELQPPPEAVPAPPPTPPVRHGGGTIARLADKHGWKIRPEGGDLAIVPRRGKREVGRLEFTERVLTAVRFKAAWHTSYYGSGHGITEDVLERELATASRKYELRSKR